MSDATLLSPEAVKEAREKAKKDRGMDVTAFEITLKLASAFEDEEEMIVEEEEK